MDCVLSLRPLHSPSGIVAFRQHLQNLARTKGILELNKVQLLYEQMGPEADPVLASASPQLQDLAGGCPQVGAAGPLPRRGQCEV